MTDDTKTRAQVEAAVNTMLGTISLTDTTHAAKVLLDTDAALRAEAQNAHDACTILHDRITDLTAEVEGLKHQVRDIANERNQATADVEGLRQRQAWIDEVGPPKHPDDERHWVGAYLEVKAQLAAMTEAYQHCRKTLGALYDHQNGCPLPKYMKPWCAAMDAAAAILQEHALASAHKETCQHDWGIDGMHSNEYCKKCFVSNKETP